jgi:hypothetical protein
MPAMTLDQLCAIDLDVLCNGGPLFWWDAGPYLIAAGQVWLAGAQCGEVA